MALLGNGKISRVIALTVLAAYILTPMRASSAAQEPDSKSLQLNEQTIKAGLVYNFLKYTTWPENPSAPEKNSLRVCLYGDNPPNSYLSPLQGQTAQQALIVLVRKDQVNDMADCSMIFVDPGQKDNLPALLAFLKDKHILTISDMDQFASLGGMVELTIEDNRIALYINENALNNAGLNIQSRLLKLAKQISK